ncbi:MAG: DUF2214 family protein [Gammaproteobacteria bacterium]|nr:DUF2214 family protein [Gammaproteobacteria bacterium]
MAYVLFRSLHLIAAVVFAGALIIKNLATGRTALWFWTGKPATFYSENPVFQIKIALFLALTGCLVYAAIFFNRHRKTQAAEISVPTTIRLSLRCAMLCLTLIPFLAWAMARGLGLSPN